MKKYCAIYLGTPAGMEKWKKHGRSDAQAARAAGHEGLDRLGREAQGGDPRHGQPARQDQACRRAQGISERRTPWRRYTIVQAESHEAAAKIFENHPHFTIFPGEAIEIMECLPIPGQ